MLRKQQKVSKYLKRFYKKQIIIINQLLKIANEFKFKLNVKKWLNMCNWIKITFYHNNFRIFFKVVEDTKVGVRYLKAVLVDLKGRDFNICMVDQGHPSKSLFYDEARG